MAINLNPWAGFTGSQKTAPRSYQTSTQSLTGSGLDEASFRKGLLTQWPGATNINLKGVGSIYDPTVATGLGVQPYLPGTYGAADPNNQAQWWNASFTPGGLPFGGLGAGQIPQAGSAGYNTQTRQAASTVSTPQTGTTPQGQPGPIGLNAQSDYLWAQGPQGVSFGDTSNLLAKLLGLGGSSFGGLGQGQGLGGATGNIDINKLLQAILMLFAPQLMRQGY